MAYQPQINRVVKAANKNIKKSLRNIVGGNTEWHEKLPYALLRYLTTIRKSTGATPYMLVYGSEAVILVEVEIPSLRIIQEVGLDDVEWIRSRIEQLMLIDEKRLDMIFPHQDEAKGKFEPNWQGPYIVHRVLSGGAVILAEMDGIVSTKLINSDAIKKYNI
ncbi:uncharacterized protein LOC107846324 [Capsicum annuum]|uniref:uncharacterized protein LOC107846324 n=1 Tax=Capsicum annuum TaxID=4072 RepID=UPI0007BF1E65|nr:uncharacterized protein LOC107846324 [Capsicum annuum]